MERKLVHKPTMYSISGVVLERKPKQDDRTERSRGCEGPGNSQGRSWTRGLIAEWKQRSELPAEGRMFEGRE